MKGISVFLYSVRQGLKNLKKNSMFTIASIGTIAACLFLFGLFYFVVGNFQHMVKSMENSVGVTVFFDEGISGEQIEAIGAAIKTQKEVDHIDFVSAEEAWKRFKEENFSENQKELADTFGEDNPLKDSANYEVYLNDSTKQKQLCTYIEKLDGVRQIKRSDETAKSLSNVNSLVGYVSIAIIVILLAVSIFLIRTTISNGITVRKAEISIMRLMGASDFFIRSPFVVEGIVIGIVGALIPLGILFAFYGRIIGFIATKFRSLSDILAFLSTGEIFSVLVPVSLLVGIGIGFLGSIFTVRKHLKA